MTDVKAVVGNECMRELILSGERISAKTPNPGSMQDVADEMAAWLRSRTEGHEPSVSACMYVAALIDTLSAQIRFCMKTGEFSEKS